MEKQGIKELMELLEAIKILTAAGMKVAIDFEVSKLISELVALGMQFGALQEAFIGIKGIVTEAQDLEEAEVVEIVKKVFEIIEVVKANLPKKEEPAPVEPAPVEPTA